MAKKPGLGRGLHSLLGNTLSNPSGNALPDPISNVLPTPLGNMVPEPLPSEISIENPSVTAIPSSLDSSPSSLSAFPSSLSPSLSSPLTPSFPSSIVQDPLLYLKDTPQEIYLSQIEKGPFQPRKHWDEQELSLLADSIKSEGVLQPILVKRKENTYNQYQIICGERRYRAAMQAGLIKIPAIVKELSEESAYYIALIENIQREDLTVLEEAEAYERLIKDYHLTHAALADRLGKSRVFISNTLRLLNLHEEVKKMLQNGSIEASHAKALASLSQNEQLTFAKKIIENGWSVRLTERMLLNKDKVLEGSEDDEDSEENANGRSNQNKGIQDNKDLKGVVDVNIKKLEQVLSDCLAAMVQIHTGRLGKGKLVIHYNSLEELDGILGHIDGFKNSSEF